MDWTRRHHAMGGALVVADEPFAAGNAAAATAQRLGLPAAVWTDRDKIGFASPVPSWLTGPLAGWADQQITHALLRAPAQLRPLLQAGLGHGERYDRARMQALMTAAWWLLR